MALVKRVEESGPWAQLYGYSRAVAVGPLVVTSACTADVESRPELLDDAGAQAKEAFRTALDAMVHAGASVADVVRSRLYVTDPAHADAVGRVHGEFFGVVKPTATVVTVARLFHPGQLVAVELEAFRAWRDLRLASIAVGAGFTARERRRGGGIYGSRASPWVRDLRLASVAVSTGLTARKRSAVAGLTAPGPRRECETGGRRSPPGSGATDLNERSVAP